MLRSSCLVVLFALPAFAANRAELVTRAFDDVKDALEEANDAPAACKKKLSPKLDSLDDAIRAAKKDPSDSTIKSAQRAADKAADTAQDACSGSSGKRLTKALEGASKSLDDALAAKEEAGPPPVLGAIAQGIGGLFAGAAKANVESSTQSSSKEWSKSSHSEKVNGKEIDEEEEAQPKKKASAPGGGGSDKFEFGATCRKNAECQSNTCYVGSGELGFCTKMCGDDWDCPRKGFEWSCYRPRNLNAPQKLCLQSKD